MSIPAPGTDETATAVYGIRKPNSLQKAKWIGRAIGRIADDVEAALQFFGLPPVVGAGMIVAASSGARDAHWGVPVTAADRLALQALGATTIRTDKGWTERYYAGLTDGGGNPSGAISAGWYPVSGATPYGALRRSGAAWTLANNAVTLATDLVTDTANDVTVGSGAGTLTITQPGLYEVVGSFVLNAAASAAGVAQTYLNKNSVTFSTNPLGFASIPNSTVSQASPTIRKSIPLVTGDVLRLFAFQTSGAGIVLPDNTSSQGQGTLFSARYLGPARA